ncbi:MAG: hypothetical protein QM736_22460 [Vicinamibacterales bacterium]
MMDETSPNYFFDCINQGSRVVTAIDPLFEAGLPEPIAQTELAELDARAAFAMLKAGATDIVRVEARRPGATGNQTAVQVREGRAARAFAAADNSPSIELRARAVGSAGTGIRVSVTSAADNKVNLVITVPPAAAQSFGPFGTTAEIVDAFATNPTIEAVKLGDALPAVQVAAQALERRLDIEVRRDGRDPSIYAGLGSLQAVGAIADPLVTFTPVPAATTLPDVNAGVPLAGGRNKGAALALAGESSDEPLLELVPAHKPPAGLAVSIERGTSTIDGSSAVVNIAVFVGDRTEETFTNLTMDPDDERYLPAVLEGSSLVRALDLFVRSRMTSIPRNQARFAPLTSGTSPLVDDYLAALERLEQAEQVDSVIASAANQLDDAGVVQVQQAVIAHCEKMATVARNRIGLGSIPRRVRTRTSRRFSATRTTCGATASCSVLRPDPKRRSPGCSAARTTSSRPPSRRSRRSTARLARTPIRSSDSRSTPTCSRSTRSAGSGSS